MRLIVDAGGTHIRYAIEQNEKLWDVLDCKSKDIGLRELIESMITKHPQIKNISLSYAGQVRDGVILSAPNRQGDEGDIKSYFEQKYDLELLIENDLYCAALAEANFFQSQDICALYVGTGLGLGVMSGGKILAGYSNIATELGHIPYKKAPFVCGCGRDNCMELFASGLALLKWKEHYGLASEMTFADLQKSSNPHAKEIVALFEEALIYAVGITITLFNPEVLVLGGGVIEQNSSLVSRVSKNIENYAFALSAKECTILKTNLQNAPLRGALLLKEHTNG